jgi:hypothetical protein
MRGFLVSLVLTLFAVAPAVGQARTSVGVTLVVAAGMGVEVQEEAGVRGASVVVGALAVEAEVAQGNGAGGLRVSFPSDRLWTVHVREAGGEERVVASGSQASTVQVGGGQEGKPREVTVTVVSP